MSLYADIECVLSIRFSTIYYETFLEPRDFFTFYPLTLFQGENIQCNNSNINIWYVSTPCNCQICHEHMKVNNKHSRLFMALAGAINNSGKAP